MRHLLDKNVWINYLKAPTPTLLARMAAQRIDDRFSCSIVLAELLFGAEKYGNRARRIELVNTTLAGYVRLPFDDAAARHYGRIRHELQHMGAVIGPNDLQIASIFLANDLR